MAVSVLAAGPSPAGGQPPRGSGRVSATAPRDPAADTPGPQAEPEAEGSVVLDAPPSLTLQEVREVARADVLILHNGGRVRGHVLGEDEDGYEVYVPGKRGEFLRTVVDAERVARVEYAAGRARAAMRQRVEWWLAKTPDFERWTEYSADFLSDWYGLRGWRVQGKFFTLETDFPEDAALAFTRRLDAIYPAYCEVWQLKPTTPKFIRARVFQYKSDYVRALARERVKADRAHSTVGMFMHRRRLVFVRDRARGLDSDRVHGLHVQSWQTLYHECHHAFVFREIRNNGRKPRFPRWIDEGLAEYFEVAQLEDGQLRTGIVNRGHVQRILHARANRSYIPLTRILASQPGQEINNKVAYPEYWALVHYLEDLGVVRERGGWRQFAGVYGRDAVRQFAKVTGKPVGVFEREWLQYIAGLR